MASRTALPAVAAACALALVLSAVPADAAPDPRECLVGPTTAATLLIPYWEVDLDAPLARTTLFSVNSYSALPELARVTLWTDWGFPTLAFDLYLTPFDIQTLNVRDLFNGVVPSTGEGADLSHFPICSEASPYHDNPVLSPEHRQQLAAWHTGRSGPMDPGCAGENHGDNVARGYATVDVVTRCSGLQLDPFHSPANTELPYFVDGAGAGTLGSARNVLWGDVLYVDVADAAAQGVAAVPVWADPGQFAGTDIYTFYGGLSGWDGRDDRVPLPFRWIFRFLDGGAFAGGAEITVWQDTGVPPERVACGGHPAWWPLRTIAVSLNEDSSGTFELGNGRFPLATQRVPVAGFGIPYPFGLIHLETRTPSSPPRQSWVESSLTAGGLFSAASDATPVESVCGADVDPLP